MEGNVQNSKQGVANKKSYLSPHHAQVWFLRRSRDGWKNKYAILKKGEKRLENRVRDVTKSRDRWASQSAMNAARLKEVEIENEALKAELESLKKK
jgi:hypothetical protein